MIYAEYLDKGKLTCGLWHMSYSKFYRLAKEQGLLFHNPIDFELHGYSYRSKKAQLYGIAVEWSMTEPPDISYGELSTIQSYFERNGKRYHMLKEFHENGIC